MTPSSPRPPPTWTPLRGLVMYSLTLHAGLNHAI